MSMLIRQGFRTLARQASKVSPSFSRRMMSDKAGAPVKPGKVAQVIGAVVDVEFEDKLPAILNCLDVTVAEGQPKLLLEVAQHTGERVV